ncbi:Protein of unknown function N-terminus (DUF3323) [Streptoalloteichus tenebrarius]|uniref:Conserved hypothetical protein CHP02679 N terminus domain-containing protein n=1 Tax=Streptoalloteichus tenebrarius (strain ATCC 17920 / DSM 40477 / JCM 4838 / CBS 697.72 / NBRC 16177 / NCIMB 11028 / NRRL B-12390 / A12253. 1 / ISP 5477) TaxID=1933 RepID=A0ABT1HW14_STRSD|nr:TIGR02679 domain-containing protein [Streptoalloteichus tenebrarius]MCP2259714.1 Protein of unknown function N-terminus (DUF3323) [Streptoalloteichus tenebrarius]BFF00692.1 hypothetical protein GCM10020241_23670 [Streptoalloteichus tenebrarius]
MSAPEVDRPELAGLWALARDALATNRTALRLEIPDQATADAVGALLGRPLRHPGRISLSLKVLRDRLATHGLDLDQVLAAVHGAPVAAASFGRPGDERWHRTEALLRTALADHGLADEPWVDQWIDGVYRYGKLLPQDLAILAGPLAAVLAVLHLDPSTPPPRRIDRAELVALPEVAALDDEARQALHREVLRAAALAHGVPNPQSTTDRRHLWSHCGVTDPH